MNNADGLKKQKMKERAERRLNEQLSKSKERQGELVRVIADWLSGKDFHFSEEDDLNSASELLDVIYNHEFGKRCNMKLSEFQKLNLWEKYKYYFSMHEDEFRCEYGVRVIGENAVVEGPTPMFLEGHPHFAINHARQIAKRWGRKFEGTTIIYDRTNDRIEIYGNEIAEV